MNLFENATVVASPKAPGKKKVPDAVVMPGLCQLAEIDALIKALSAAKSSIESSVKAEAFDYFFNEAQQTAKRPGNFKGIDGIATASIEMRKRSSASALSEEEVEMFKANNLEVEKVVAVQRMYGINPVFATDTQLLGKVSKALEGIVPSNFIVIQEERSKYVVGESTIEKAFTSKAPREIIEAVTTMAIKPKLEETDIALIIDSVKTMLIDEDFSK